jgi:RNA polymerase sigma-70 factor (ECF subfamily)
MREKEQAFERAFEAHVDELFRHAYLRLSDRERANEVVQETFLRTWDYVSRGQEVRDYRAFLYRTLRHLIIDEYRRHKSISLESMLSDESQSIEDLMPPDNTNTLEAATIRYDGARVLGKVQELPDIYREVILLRYVEGLSPQEIARYLNESENVVSVRIHRGLKKLKMLLEPEP